MVRFAWLHEEQDMHGQGKWDFIICLQEEPDEHGQGKWEGKQRRMVVAKLFLLL
jgi:hypothetical protein